MYKNSFSFALYAFLILISHGQNLLAQWDTLSTGTSSILYGVQFADVNTGWIIGEGGLIRKSIDGGVSWTSQSSNTIQNLRRITMFDANTGFICGDSGKILKTVNGGNTWTNMNNTASSADLYAMDFINSSTGICAGESRTQLKTTNGGANWSSGSMSGVSSSVNILGLDMTDANTVFVSTTAGGLPAGGKVYKSVNFGTNYNISLDDFLYLGTAALNDIKFINASVGYTCASNGRYAFTNNEGASWTFQSFEQGINQIFFSDSLHGFMCGEDLLKTYTENGGNNWTIDFNYNNVKTLFGISFLNITTGWMSGSNGLLIKTTTGGQLPSSCDLNNLSWIKSNDEISNCLDIEIDSCGNIYTTGLTRISSDTNILVQKFSNSGYLYWTKTYGTNSGDDVGKVIKLDAAGNIYVTGYVTSGSLDKDIILLKYTPDGQLNRASDFDTLNYDQESVDMAIDNSGNIFIAGKSNLVSGAGYDYQILKFNSSGSVEWNRRYNYNDDIPVAIVTNNSGQVFITGSSFSTILNNYEITTLKYNATGSLQWTNRSGISGQATCMTIGSLGNNIYVIGYTNSISNNNFVTLKYSTAGSLGWERYLDGGLGVKDIPVSVDLKSGNIVISGYILNFSTLQTEFLTAKYDSDGNLQWGMRYTHPAYSSYSPKDVVIDNFENIYIAGNCRNSYTSDDIATLKYNPSGVLQKINFYDTDSSGDFGNAIGVDNLGNVFAGGKTFDKSTLIKYEPYDFSGNVLSLNFFIEGFYNSTSNTMVSDTIMVTLRYESSPYAAVDSAKSIISSTGNASFEFINASSGTNFYIVIRHRNSIEIWSAAPQSFTSGILNYDFTNASSQAYGSNMIQVDASPVKFAVYSGDVNQDGTVDATDVSAIDNDAANFMSGYVVTDLTGDDFVDGTDFAIADNNAANFVSVIRP